MARGRSVNEIQAIVDLLAQELGRPVGVDDRRFRAVAYSSHPSDVDTVRRESIMGREAPAEVAVWLESLGLAGSRGLVRVPANDALEMVSRVCFPLWFHNRLLGFLWLIEDEATLSAVELSLSAMRAEEIATELARVRAQESAEREEESSAVDSVVSGDSVISIPGLASASTYVAIVLDYRSPAGAHESGADVVLAEAVDRARRGMAPRHLLGAVRGDRAVLLLACYDDVEPEQRALAIVHDLQQRRSPMPDGSEATVCVGGLRLDQAELHGSYEEASLAARVARNVRDLPSPVFWSRIGPLALVARLLDGRDPGALIPASLKRLLSDPDGGVLVQTLGAYLDHGGDAAAAAESLYIHRSSLYKRLHRAEEIAGIDLSRGTDRLELHLGLQLRRLGGR